MPCSDSSSIVIFRLDPDEKFVSFDFAKVTCGRSIAEDTGYQRYCRGKTLPEILDISYAYAADAMGVAGEEQRFVLYLEWDALRSAAAQYLGCEDETIDRDRCHICSVEYHEDGVEVAMIILPPKEMPKILPCA